MLEGMLLNRYLQLRREASEIHVVLSAEGRAHSHIKKAVCGTLALNA